MPAHQQFDVGIATDAALAVAGTTERYRKLQRWKSHFDCVQHDHKEVDWDGSLAPNDELDKYQIEAGQLGTSAIDKYVPLRYRRPTSPFHVARPVVETFTDLLFDEDRCPKIIVKSDKKDQEWFRELADITNWWSHWSVARDNGGACGTAAVAFHFDSGVPKLEVLDARHSTPEFSNSRNHESLVRITIQYVYESEEQVKKQGSDGVYYETAETVMRWYKRTIDAFSDVVYTNPEYKENKTPVFEEKHRVDHGLGFVPAVWVQNLPGCDGIDGFPDYYGATELFEVIDQLLSQSTKGSLYNVDPTAHIGTDRKIDEIRSGSFNAIVTEKGGTVALVEHTGEAIGVVLAQAEQLRQYALLICRCVLDRPQSNDRDRVTATEIQKTEMSMFARANRLRRSWGDAIKRLLILIGRAARAYSGKKFTRIEYGEPHVYEYAIKMPEGVDPAPGRDDPIIQLRWGRFIHIAPNELKALIEALSAAREAKIIDLDTAVEMLAQYIPYKDPVELVAALEAEIAAEAEEIAKLKPEPKEPIA